MIAKDTWTLLCLKINYLRYLSLPWNGYACEKIEFVYLVTKVQNTIIIRYLKNGDKY